MPRAGALAVNASHRGPANFVLNAGRPSGSTVPAGSEKKMDFNSLQNYMTSLGLLYAWTLFAAVVFALGERLCRSLFARKEPALSGAKDPAIRTERPATASTNNPGSA
jgi:hypothetical protein